MTPLGSSSPDTAPSVQVVVEQIEEPRATAGEVPPPNDRRQPALIAGLVVIGLVAVLGVLSVASSDGDDDALDDSDELAIPEVSEPASTQVFSAPALSLATIHRYGKPWFSIDPDQRLIMSRNLLDWSRVESAKDRTTLALDSSSDELVALVAQGSEVSLAQLQPDGTLVDAPVATSDVGLNVAAVRGEHWVAAGTEGGVPGIVTSAAVADDHAIVAASFGGPGTRATLLTTIPLDHRSESDGMRCHLMLLSGELLQTPDGVIHYTRSTETWVVSPDAAEIARVLSIDDLDQMNDGTSGARSIAPIPTGGGWSVLGSVIRSEGDEQALWVTHDGSRLEQLDLPAAVEPPGHIQWAFVGASEGVGVRTGSLGEQTVHRIVDARAWHPRPHNLARVKRIEPKTESMPIDTTTCAAQLSDDLN